MSKNYWIILELSPGASSEEIKKARDRLAKKYHPDKPVPAGLTKEKQKEKFQEIQEAYEILTGSGGGGGPQFDTCDYCGGKYDFDRENYPKWKEFQKKNGEGEKFNFCKKQRAECYDNFFFCYICEETSVEKKDLSKWKKKRGQNIYFCSDDCQKKFNSGDFDQGNSKNSCCKCGKPVGDSDLICEGGSICISCATKKCKYCEKEGLPVEGNGWAGYINVGWFCSQTHYIKWKNDNQNQEDQEDTSESPKNIRTNKNGGKEGETDGDNLDNNFESNFDDNSNDNSNQDGKENKENNTNLPKDFQEIGNLSLSQACQKAEEKIEKLLKDNKLSEQELEKKDWKDYLRNLDSPKKVAEFAYQMQQAILKKALTKKAVAAENKKPKNDLILPGVIISVLLLLVLSTLIIVVRKRRQRSF